MVDMELVVGKKYWVIGQGPMRLEALPISEERPGIPMFGPEGDVRYWAGKEQLLPLILVAMNQYVGDLKARGLDTPDLLAWHEEVRKQHLAGEVPESG